jgi:hypothetical protein
LVLVAIIRLVTATATMTTATKIVRSIGFPLVVGALVGVGVGVDVWVAWSAGFPCCWAYTEAGIAPGPADELELEALVEPVSGVAVAAYGVTQ